MAKEKDRLNKEVTKFLDDLNHPFRKEIEQLRIKILNANPGLTENIKWNGPNYRFDDNDRITMRINPPKQIQLIFHRGAKVQEQPEDKLITDNSGILVWKTNDRAVATFKSMEEITSTKEAVSKIINDWLSATT